MVANTHLRIVLGCTWKNVSMKWDGADYLAMKDETKEEVVANKVMHEMGIDLVGMYETRSSGVSYKDHVVEELTRLTPHNGSVEYRDEEGFGLYIHRLFDTYILFDIAYNHHSYVGGYKARDKELVDQVFYWMDKTGRYETEEAV